LGSLIVCLVACQSILLRANMESYFLLVINDCNTGFVLKGLPADTLAGHRDRFYAQYHTYVLVVQC